MFFSYSRKFTNLEKLWKNCLVKEKSEVAVVVATAAESAALYFAS